MGWLDDCPTRLVDGIFLFFFFGPHVDIPLTAKEERERKCEYLLTHRNNHNSRYSSQQILRYVRAGKSTGVINYSD